MRLCVHFFHFIPNPKFQFVISMNAFDPEFWNGALKASIMIERDLKKLLNEASENEKEGIKGRNCKDKGNEGEH